MNLIDKLHKELNEAHPALSGFKQIGADDSDHEEVDWDFDKVDIIKSSLGKKKEGGGGSCNKKGNVHDIDPPPEEESKGKGKSSKMKQFDRPSIQIGSIVQDHKTGQKGKVVNIDGDKIEIEPLTPSEMRDLGVELKRDNRSSNRLLPKTMDFGRFK